MIADIVSEILAPSVDGIKTALKPVPKPLTQTNQVMAEKPGKTKKPKSKTPKGKNNHGYKLQFNTKDLVPQLNGINFELPGPLVGSLGFHHIPELLKFHNMQEWNNFKGKTIQNQALAAAGLGSLIGTPIASLAGAVPAALGSAAIGAVPGTTAVGLGSLPFTGSEAASIGSESIILPGLNSIAVTPNSMGFSLISSLNLGSTASFIGLGSVFTLVPIMGSLVYSIGIIPIFTLGSSIVESLSSLTSLGLNGASLAANLTLDALTAPSLSAQPITELASLIPAGLLGASLAAPLGLIPGAGTAILGSLPALGSAAIGYNNANQLQPQHIGAHKKAHNNSKKVAPNKKHKKATKK